METEPLQFELDLDHETARQDLSDAIAELIAGIEGALTSQHLESLVSNKVEQTIGILSEQQRASLHSYLKDKSYSRIDPDTLADLLLAQNCTTNAA